MNDLITEPELMEVLKVSRTTLWKLRKEGLPAAKVGRKVMYDYQAVLNWLKENGGK